ncbi:PKD domain-containing protein [Sessilibacter corallicola]|uniref:PKD/Chitinase domain-containing protein n=1 Tax=Sessilibacter corallicola TaxID=2904075 RepID=A0ABQ0A9J0_9GAMM
MRLLKAWIFASVALLVGCFGINALPTITDITAPETVQSGELVQLSVTAEDSDGRVVAYLWEPLDSSITLMDADQATSFFVAPDVSEATSLNFQITVTDDANESAQSSITVTVQPRPVVPPADNVAPNANAGIDIFTQIDQVVTLDGSASTDCNGDELKFNWLAVSRPEGSSAELNNPELVRPFFTPDIPGDYRFMLTVSDGFELTVDEVIVSTQSVRPVARAGLPQIIIPGETITLDASNSFDVDGSAFTVTWNLVSVPIGSSTELDNRQSLFPNLTPDIEGEYRFELTVSDALGDGESTELTLQSAPLVVDTNAGVDQSVLSGERVQLSSPNALDPDAGLYDYQWHILSRPEDSEALLEGDDRFNPELLIDAEGDYVVQLIISSPAGRSAADTVLISTNNSRPTSIASAERFASLGNVVALDGDASFDADTDLLTAFWTLTIRPEGSAAQISEVVNLSSEFTPDLTGLYVAQLIVSDGALSSIPDTVIIEVSEPPPPSNSAPRFVSVPIVEAEIDQDYQYELIAFDPDGDTLTFAIIEGPLGMRLDAQEQLVSWLPVDGGVSSVVLSVSDGINPPVEQRFEITVNGLDDRSPVLEAIGDQTAFLGQFLSLQLNATDPNGDPITYQAEPLPLPDNMLLDAQSGELTFAPIEGQSGEYEITFRASDGRFNDSETVLFTVPAPGEETALSGRVLTENDQPLPGVRLEINGEAQFTDSDGSFTFDGIVEAGDQRLLVDGSTVDPSLGSYATVPEVVHLVAGAINHLPAPIFLLPLDTASADPVNPERTSIITSSRFRDGLSLLEPARLTIPPGAAIDDATGQPFEGDITITFLEDITRSPQPLPEGIGASSYISIQPFGVSYPEPVPISFPNTENLPPGSRVDIFALNHETGQFEVVGEGEVSANGATINSIGGVVDSNSWHAWALQLATLGLDFVGNVIEPVCSRKVRGACSVDRETGNLKEWHDIPSYYSLGAERAVRLEYNSNLANPNPIIPLQSQFGNQSPPPTRFLLEGRVGNRDVNSYRTNVAVSGRIAGQFLPLRPAIQFDAFDISSGLYRHEFRGTHFVNGSFRQTRLAVDLPIHNLRRSSYGAGWNIVGLQRIYPETSIRSGETVDVMLTDGSAASYVFTGPAVAEALPPAPGTAQLILAPIPPYSYESPPGEFSTLTFLEDRTWERVMKDGTRYLFNQDGFMVEEIDRNGNRTTYEYEGERIVRITDPVGQAFEFFYFFGDRLDRIVDPMGRTTRFEQDSNGNLITIIEPNGDRRRFEYNAQRRHLMSAQFDQRGNRKAYEYSFADRIERTQLPDGSTQEFDLGVIQGLPDFRQITSNEDSSDVIFPSPPFARNVSNRYTDQNGNVDLEFTDGLNVHTEFRDAVGRIYRSQRDNDSNPITTTRPNNSVIQKIFDDLGNMLSRREVFNGAVDVFEYDQFSLVTRYVNPNNHQMIYNRDERGNALNVINELGHTTFMEYDSRGLITRLLTPNNLEILFEYNEQGLLVTQTEIPPSDSPGNVRVTQYSYDAAGQTTEILTPDNITYRFRYDEKGRVTQVSDNLNQIVNYFYDAYNNLTRADTISSNGLLARTVDLNYDSRNRLISVSAPHEDDQFSVTRWSLDGNSLPRIARDPKNQFSSAQFDAEDRVTQSVHRLDGITEFDYDTNDRVTRIVAPNGVETLYTYDILGRMLSEESPDRGRLNYSYDRNDNLLSMTDGRGITMNYSYDELERPISKRFPNSIPGKIEDVTYIYDDCSFGVGRLCRRVDETGMWDYAYDAFGNVVSITRNEQGQDFTTQYVYDNGDNVIQKTYPTGKVISISRDGVRRTQSISTTINGAAQTIVSDIEYRGDNAMTQCRFGNGLEDTRSYDLQGRLQTQDLLDGNSAIDSRRYSYDLNSNVIERDTSPQLSVYAYDALDRIVSDQIDNGLANTLNYDLNFNRLDEFQTSEAANDYLYESGSNRLSQISAVTELLSESRFTERELIFNDANRLFQVIDDGVVTAEYIYNDQGQRTRKTVFDSQGATAVTLYHYDMYGMLIAETAENGVTEKEYLWHESGDPLAQIDTVLGEETLYYLHADHLMTPRFATDSNRNIAWLWEGEAFGETPDDILSAEVNLRFPGQYHDRETDLYYNWNRYYDPDSGRYITSDPLGLYAGLNTYNYVDSNSLRFYDPTGEHPAVDVVARVFAAGAKIFGKLPKKPKPKLKKKQCEVNASKPDGYVTKGALKQFGRSIDDLSSAASQPFKNSGLTKAARALDKHAAGQRASGTFPKLSGNTAARNKQAQGIVDDILNNSKSEFKTLGRGGLEVRSPSGQGIRFNKDGSFSGFVD